MSETSIGVFIIEEHELGRQGLADLVAAAPDLHVAGTARTAEESLPLVGGSNPDVVLLGVRLDGVAIAAGRRIRSEHPDVRCVLLTTFDDDEALFTAVMAGAAGYLVKQVGGSSLLDGVRAVAEGRSLVDGAVAERLLDRLRRSGQGDHRGGSLDEREQQVLELVGQGCTDVQIAEKLDGSVPEVEGLVSSIYGKLAPRHGGGPERR